MECFVPASARCIRTCYCEEAVCDRHLRVGIYSPDAGPPTGGSRLCNLLEGYARGAREENSFLRHMFPRRLLSTERSILVFSSSVNLL